MDHRQKCHVCLKLCCRVQLPEELSDVYNLLQMIYMRNLEIDNTQNSQMYIFACKKNITKQTLQINITGTTLS